jgi:hypothetical protein
MNEMRVYSKQRRQLSFRHFCGTAAIPRSLTFYARAGLAAPAAIPVAITPLTPGSTHTATSNQVWLQPNPNAITNVTGTSMALSVDQASLAARTYPGIVQFASPGFFGSSTGVTFGVANPSGTLKAASSPVVGSDPGSAAVAHFNENSKPGLAVADMGDGVTMLLGDGTGGFTAPLGVHRVLQRRALRNAAFGCFWNSNKDSLNDGIPSQKPPSRRDAYSQTIRVLGNAAEFFGGLPWLF